MSEQRWTLCGDVKVTRFRPASEKEKAEDGREIRPMNPIEKIHFRLEGSYQMWRICKSSRTLKTERDEKGRLVQKRFTSCSIAVQRSNSEDWKVLSSGDSVSFFFEHVLPKYVRDIEFCSILKSLIGS